MEHAPVIHRLTADHPDFGPIVKPILASVARRKEMPYLNDAPGRVWLVAMVDGIMRAFLTYDPAKARIREAWYHTPCRKWSEEAHAYVMDEFPAATGILKTLLAQAESELGEIGQKEGMAVIQGLTRPLMESVGWKVDSNRGRTYVVLKKVLS